MPYREPQDRQPGNLNPICQRCATWICHECWEFRRYGASLHTDSQQICAKCGGTRGVYVAVRHNNPRRHQ